MASLHGEVSMSLSIADLACALKEYVAPDQIRRHELTNPEWRLVRSSLPGPAATGRPRKSDRIMLNGMLWILRTGAPWRDLPERYGPWRSVWRRFDRWRRAGVIEGLQLDLLEVLNDSGELDWDLWCVDGSSVRASRAAVGAHKKGGPKASPKTMR